MSWLASLAPFVMAAGTGIANAIGTHIGNKAMQNTTTSNAGAQTSDVPVQSVETSDNAIALPEDVAQPVIVDGTGGTIGDQFKSTAKKEEPKPELKLEDVRAVLAEKSRAGHTAEVRALLKKYGAAKLSEIVPANYEALMKDAEVIGNGS